MYRVLRAIAGEMPELPKKRLAGETTSLRTRKLTGEAPAIQKEVACRQDACGPDYNK